MADNASLCIDVGTPCGMISNIDAMVQMASPVFSQPGSWADADMLEVMLTFTPRGYTKVIST
jgi:hypothetical protein